MTAPLARLVPARPDWPALRDDASQLPSVRVLAALMESYEPRTSAELGAELGISVVTCNGSLRTLMARGLASRVGYRQRRALWVAS